MGNSATIVVPERTEVTHRDQFYKEDGTFYVSSEVVSAEGYSFDENDPTAEPYVENLVLDEVFYDTAQLSGWSQDDTGYNFKWTLPGIAFPLGGRKYRVEIRVMTDSDSNFAATAEHTRVFFVETRGSRAV